MTSLRAARLQAAAQDDVLLTRHLLDCGVSKETIRLLTASGTWQRLLRGTILLSPERTGVAQQRSYARSGLLLSPGAALSHHTAAILGGLQGVPRLGAVQVVRPGKLVSRPGFLPHRAALPPSDVVDLDGLLLTAPERTLADLVPTLTRLEAVAVVDSALRTAYVDREGLRRAERQAAGHRGYRTTADVWLIADPLAASPLESRVRLRCLDAGLTPEKLQYQVRDDDGVLVATADLAFRRGPDTTARLLLPRQFLPGDDGRPRLLQPLLVEAEGRRYHPDQEDPSLRPGDPFVWDRRRHNAVQALGYPIVRSTWADTTSALVVPAAVRAML